MITCYVCQREVDPEDHTLWHRVEGWERRRRGGGTNHVALRRELPDYIHAECMRDLQRGVTPGQGQLV